MSTTAPAPGADAVIEPPRMAGGIPERVRRDDPRRKRKRNRKVKGATLESLCLFVGLYAVYLALGYQVVVEQHLIVFDATARLAHAYFVWWNDPPKLAAIGFVWAPLSTLVFLPFAAIKPLASSLMALPACSGAWMALMFVSYLRLFRFLGLGPLARWSIVLLTALNPMLLYYAVNGMSEAPFLALTAIGVGLFVRWYVTREPLHLALCALALTMAGLCRYELLIFAAIVAVAVPVTLWAERRSEDEVEGSLLAYAGPVVYGVGLWCFFNYVILGDPIYWFRQQFLGATDSITPTAPAAADAVQTGAGGAPAVVQGIGVGEIVQKVVDVNVRLFPLLLVLMVLLALRFLVRRDGLSFWLMLLAGANAMTTTLLIQRADSLALLQLRYNMRALPVAIIAIGWLLTRLRPGALRGVASLGVALALAASIPLTWETMRTYPFQYLERTFTEALRTGTDQEGTGTGGQYTVGNRDDREMAAFIRAHVPLAKGSILTDDGQTFGVMLATGRPQIFRDRIDQGDAKWAVPLGGPWRRVRYILVARYPRSPFQLVDEIEKRYPGMTALPGVAAIHANDHYALLRVAPRRPRDPQTRFDDPLERIRGDAPPRL